MTGSIRGFIVTHKKAKWRVGKLFIHLSNSTRNFLRAYHRREYKPYKENFSCNT